MGPETQAFFTYFFHVTQTQVQAMNGIIYTQIHKPELSVGVGHTER